ncbi:AAA family ATPase [Saliterribacillus persicus]|uniref:AAA domain-containing protein n=1 Tax=Saliterribacillus persicus TaxID=930114 RepID=A0A368Y5A5_9BACI|nr:AAA family ATPase [Saliterribacillus persicus]RCW74929.1 AAA domain-containing protein [Saliterribacillus persicus]
MKLVLLFGPPAVGKMTVGQELEKQTGLKLFHNHMTIELLHPFFGFSQEMFRLSTIFREGIFKSFIKTDHDGMIFTFVWAFDQDEDWKFVESMCNIFTAEDADIYFVELEADTDERLERNKTPNRLEHKATKNNLEASEQNLLNMEKEHRMNSKNGELPYNNYVRINNTHLSAEEVAKRIRKEFRFPLNERNISDH